LAISFTTPRELFMLERIARLTRIRVRREKLPTAAEAARKKTEILVDKVKLLIAEASFPANKAATQALLENGATPEQVVAALLHLLVPPKSLGAPGHSAADETDERPRSRPYAGSQNGRGRHPGALPQAERRTKPHSPQPVSRQIRDPAIPGNETSPPRHRKPSFNKARPWGARAASSEGGPSRPPRRNSRNS
jgi:hypothetical protein